MSILEVAATYPLAEYTVQYDDCLWVIAFKLYQRDDNLVRRILCELNVGIVDWDSIEPLTSIKYLSKDKISLVDEVDF